MYTNNMTPSQTRRMDTIKVGSKVTHKSDPNSVGTVKELWAGKRAYVVWPGGLEAWEPLHSLKVVK